MINTIQINNFMKTRRRSIRRNEVIDINQIISDLINSKLRFSTIKKLRI